MRKSTDPVRQLELDNAIAQARKLRESGKVSEAAQLAAKVVQADSSHVGALRLMASLAMQTGTAEIAIGSLSRATVVSPRSPEVFVELGDALLFGGKPSEAGKAFLKAIALRPRDGSAFRGLGKAQLDMGKHAEALRSFRKAHEILPYDLYSAHIAAALSGVENPSLPAYVGELFDNYAGYFDEHLTDTLRYRIPQKMRELIGQHMPETTAASLLDLGCGTGLVGVHMQDIARDMDGIDISRQMILKAEQRNIYRHLRTGDLMDVLSRDPGLAGPYDLITAADVFIYVQELAPVFEAVRKRLGPKSLFVFSVETSQGNRAEIRSTGRFGHSEAHIADLIAKNRFSLVASQPADIRHERHEPVPGMVYLLGPG